MKIKIATIIASLAISSVAAAQGLPRNASYWKYSTRTSTPVKMYQYMPTICRPALQRAVATYNAQRSRFTLTHSPSVVSTNNLEQTRDADLVVSYSMNLQNAGALAEVPYTRDAQRSTSFSFGPNFFVTDTDVLFSFNRLFYGGSTADTYGDMFCPAQAGRPVPSNKLDFETAVLHELVHAAGLSHFDGTGCVMRDVLNWGQASRSFCSQEATVIRNLYGTQ